MAAAATIRRSANLSASAPLPAALVGLSFRVLRSPSAFFTFFPAFALAAARVRGRVGAGGVGMGCTATVTTAATLPTHTCVSHGALTMGRGSRRRLPTGYHCYHRYDTSTMSHSMDSTCRLGDRGGAINGTTTALCNLLSWSHNSSKYPSP